MRIGAFFSLIVGIQEADEELVSAAFRRRKSERNTSRQKKLSSEMPQHFRQLVTRGLADPSDYFEFVQQRGVAQKRLEAILEKSLEDKDSLAIVASPLLLISQAFKKRDGRIV